MTESNGPSAFFDTAPELRTLIDEELARRTRFGADCPAPLAEAVRYALLGSGKRLRPLLTLWAAELCGARRSDALPAACAVEMIHCYSLIHDDLPAMDNDDLRRGRPTVHKQFDEATAILAGDGLLAFAFETICDTVPNETAARCVRLLAQAAGCCGMVGGQTDDVLFAAASEETREKIASAEWLEAIHRRKTAAMILVALELGATVAGADARQIDALKRYGQAFGLAFQITDDLLDMFGDEATVGKRVGKDAEAGKLTFPAYWGVEESRRRAAEEIQMAREALGVFPDSAAKRQLTALADYVLSRNR